MESILQLDGAKTVQQITSLEGATPTNATPTAGAASNSLSRVSLSPVEGVQGSGVGGADVTLRDQAVSGSISRVTHSDLDTLASQAAGVAER